jgi:hypothetical protein
MNEKERLCSAVDEFAEAMKNRLIQKQKQGFSGWDEGDVFADDIPKRLFGKTAEMYAMLYYSNMKKVVKKKMAVDIANFAMMIWRKLKA